MKIKVNKHFPFKGFLCINWFDTLYFRRDKLKELYILKTRDWYLINSKQVPSDQHLADMFEEILLTDSFIVELVGEDLINHETIHSLQARELGHIGFYILYALEWLIRFLLPPYKDGMETYDIFPFEREANENESDMGYFFYKRKILMGKVFINKYLTYFNIF